MTPKNSVATVGEGESHHYEVRKINNGFVLKHSHSTPKDYKVEETYHPTMPKIFLQATATLPVKEKQLPEKKSAPTSPVKRTTPAKRATTPKNS